MEVYDIIHGNIHICDTAKKIIDTVEFQRLRKIKQLGCCYLVFPSAVHTRFEHSIGVYHLAKVYLCILNKNNSYFTDREALCISIAGLIHDIGHGPYSHLFDEIISKEKNHEYRSGEMLKIMNAKYDLGFSSHELDFILKIIYPKGVDINPAEKYKYQIISNETGIDVDRFDYIKRDIRMTGLNYGIESMRIMQHSKIIDGKIVYSNKVKTNIEDFFRTRYIMYLEVYNHRTVRRLEYMMKEFLININNLINIKEMINNDNFDEFIKINDTITDVIHYMPLNDTIVLLKEIMENINKRQLYKSVGEITFPYSTTNPDPTTSFKKYRDIIIDKIIINYYGKEECEFYSNDKYKKIQDAGSKNKDILVISIYYKEPCNKEEAMEYFNSLIPISI